MKAFLTSDEAEGPSLRLTATILAHGPPALMETHVATYLPRVLNHASKKLASLEALLLLLRGRFFHLPSFDIYPETPRKTTWTLPCSPTAYSFAGLMGGRAKFMDRLKSIKEELIDRKSTFAAIFETASSSTTLTQYMVEILLQLSSHSLRFALYDMFPAMFKDPDKQTGPFYALLAIRVLGVIIDPDSGFYDNVACKASKEEYVKREHAEKLFETKMLTTFSHCDQSVGIQQAEAGWLVSAFVLPMSVFLPPSNSVEIVEIPEAYTSANSLLLLQNIRNGTVMDSEQQEDALLRDAIKTTQAGLSKWFECLPPGIGELPKVPGVLRRQRPSTMDRRKKAAKGVAVIDNLELYREVLRLAPLIPAKFLTSLGEAESFLGKLVLHEDEDVATCCAHAMQRIVFFYPEHRLQVLQGFVLLYKSKCFTQEVNSPDTLDRRCDSDQPTVPSGQHLAVHQQ